MAWWPRSKTEFIARRGCEILPGLERLFGYYRMNQTILFLLRL
ncbi:unnamed protein product [Brassica rapa subsp. trilocularis]